MLFFLLFLSLILLFLATAIMVNRPQLKRASTLKPLENGVALCIVVTFSCYVLWTFAAVFLYFIYEGYEENIVQRLKSKFASKKKIQLSPDFVIENLAK